MRPKGRGELDSLYFSYPKFEAPTDRTRLSRRTPVAIVGAGPVGLTAALTLAKYKIASVVLERKSTFNDGSRAICIARSSFNILSSIGAVVPFLEKSLGWKTGRTFYRGQQILEFDMPDSLDERFRPMYNLQQQYIEKFLWEIAEASDWIDLRWQSEVTAVSQSQDEAILSVTDSKDSYDLPAGWVLAADGAHSPLRRMLGLRLKGENYEGRYVIADVRMKHNYPTIRRALFDPDCRPGGTVLIHRQPDDIWRIDYQLRDWESEEEATREDVVRRSVAGVLAEVGHEDDWDLEWWSIYSANTLALDDYRSGLIFFIGDSAHIVPIFGVRGLNNGLADAHNISWKLAWLINGRAEEKILESYTPERRGATLDVFENATKSTRFMTPPTAGWRTLRDAALSLALRYPFTRSLSNPRQMAPYTYADSPGVVSCRAGFKAGPWPGAMVPDSPLDQGFLSEKLGDDFVILVFGNRPDWENCLKEATLLCLPTESHAAQIYGAEQGETFLIRPDMHLAARWPKASWADVNHALLKSTGREKEHA